MFSFEESIGSRLGALRYTFLEPGSTFSLFSLACAGLVAAGWFAWTLHRRGYRVTPRALRRLVLPARMFRHPSARADWWLFLLNNMVFVAALGWAYVAPPWLTARILEGLTFAFGPAAPLAIDPVAAAVILTLAMFLAYELGYYAFHWAAHNVPGMWEFHKIHHTAEVLTPATVWRVHPIEQVVYANTLTFFSAIAEGLGAYLLGQGSQAYMLAGTNVILLAFVFFVIHLQHSEVWLPFTGTLGRFLLSPAHHQIHHSTNPAHFNRNLGSCLAIWDWAFGTLHVPGKKREAVEYGLGPEANNPHDVVHALFEPVWITLDRLNPWRAGAKPPVEQAVTAGAPQPGPAGR